MARDFTDHFATFTRSAWRLEVRDVYQVGDQTRIDDYLRTGRPPVKTRKNSPWIVTIEDAIERGATIGRVRLVGHPMTDYTRFELAAYRANIAAGEDIRIVDRARLDSSWDSAPDVWILDDTTALLMNYDDAGRWLGFDEVRADPYLPLRERLVPHAVPVHDYQLVDDLELDEGMRLPIVLPAGVSV